MDRPSAHAAFTAASHLSDALVEIADRLDTAHDPGSFIAALRTNGRVWREVAVVAPMAGCPVADEDCGFMADMCDRAGNGVDDHEVEAIIAINRRLAERLAQIPSVHRPSGAEVTPLWREWMGRHARAVTWRDGSPDRVAS